MTQCKGPVTLHNDNNTITCIHALIGQNIYRYCRTEKKIALGERLFSRGHQQIF